MFGFANDLNVFSGMAENRLQTRNFAWQRTKISAILIGIGLVLSSCVTTQVQINGSDSTAPLLKFGSLNLVPEFGLGVSAGRSKPGTPSIIESVTTFPEQLGFDGRNPSVDAIVTARAEDGESGVRGVELRGDATVFCNASWTTPTPARRVLLTLAPATNGDLNPGGGAGGSQPLNRTASMTLRYAQFRNACGTDVVTDFEINLQARSRNGSDIEAGSTARIVRPLNVVVMNIWAPCLRELAAAGDRNLNGVQLCDRLHNQQPGVGPGQMTHLNEQLDRWARYFARQDIVLLNEATDPAWLARMSINMPDHAVAHRGAVAILSRFPLSNVSFQSTPPVCVTDLDGVVVCGINAVYSEAVRATAATPRGSVDVISLHWQHRPVPVTSHPSRVAFAQQITQASLGSSSWTLVGGDFNSKSVFIGSPDELDSADARAAHVRLGGRSQPEIAEMESIFTDARRQVREKDTANWSHSFGWPVDHVFVRNDLDAVLYTNDQTGMFGTDHPTIRVSLLRR